MATLATLTCLASGNRTVALVENCGITSSANRWQLQAPSTQPLRLFECLAKRYNFRLERYGRFIEAPGDSGDLAISASSLEQLLVKLAAPNSLIVVHEAPTYENQVLADQNLIGIIIFGELDSTYNSPAKFASETASLQEHFSYADSPDPELRKIALLQAYGLETTAAIATVTPVLQQDPAVSVRLLALQVLAYFGEPAFDAISHGLSDPIPLVRLRCLEILVAMNPHKSLPLIAQIIYADPVTALKTKAWYLLEKNSHEAAQALLLNLQQPQ